MPQKFKVLEKVDQPLAAPQATAGCGSIPAPGSALTVEVLKSLKFGLRMHLNGGNQFSRRVSGNDEWGLSLSTETNGSPNYFITEEKLRMDGNESLVLDLRRGVPDYEGFCRSYNEWRAANPSAERRSETDIQAEAIHAAVEKSKAERIAKMPDEKAAINALFEAYQRLQELGWENAIYCPKDRTQFKVIEAGSTGIHDCIYDGEWPKGSWWVHSDGDSCPSRPILWKPNSDSTTQKG